MIGERLWRRRFGSDLGVIGRSITLTGQPHTIVGVLPAGQIYPRGTELWTPLVVPPESNQRGWKFVYSVARLKPGVTVEQAQANMTDVARGIRNDHPGEYHESWTVNVIPMQEVVMGSVRASLWILLGAVGFVLLIACANVANLLLARGAAREKEIAIRAALGAARPRLVRQMLTESVLLGSCGGLAGFILAWIGTRLFVLFGPPDFPRMGEVGPDLAVLSYTLGLSVVTGLFFGLAPVWQTPRHSLIGILRTGPQGGGGFGLLRHDRLRNLLVVGEIALAFVLLAGAGLLLRSYWRLTGEETGFQPGRVLAFEVELPFYKYSDKSRQRDFFEQLVEKARRLPGTVAAAAVNTLPFSGSNRGWTVILREKTTEGKNVRFTASYRLVTPGYFRTMEVPLLRGRTFTDHDTAAAEPVIVVSETFARRHFPEGNALGQPVRINRSPVVWRTIVGVVQDVKHRGLNIEDRPAIYTSIGQVPAPSMFIVVRTETNPAALAAPLRRAVRGLDPNQPIGTVATMEHLISASVARPRFYTVLLLAFAGAAALLAVVGIYGVMSFAVQHRTHEIGIRMALGAQPGNVLRLVLGQGLAVTSVGLLFGLGGAYALTRTVQSLLYEITPTDPLTFVSIPLLLGATALLACYIPARRATKVDPMVALRYE